MPDIEKGIELGVFENAARKIVKRMLGGSYTFVMPLAPRDRRVVNETGAYYSVAFLSCMLAKSRPLASLPVRVYQEVDGHSEKADHPLNRILSKRWNAFMTASDGWNWLVLRRDTFGMAYVRVSWNSKGEPTAFYPVDSPVELLFDRETETAYYEVQNGDDFTEAGRYAAHEILVFKTPVSTDGGVSGVSFARLAAENVGLSVDLEQFYSRLLRNGSHFPGYFETDDDLENNEKEAIAASMKAASGVVEAGTVRIFDKGLKYRQNPMTMGDINLVDQQTWVLQQCCRVLGVPPSAVYENSRSTYSNVETMELQFARTTLTNEASSIEGALQPVLDAMEQRFPGCYAKFDLNGYMRGDYKSRMEGYRTGVYAGFFTRAEVREWEDLPPIEGLDEPLQPTAYYPLRDGVPINPDNTLAPVKADMESRVRARFREGGDTPKTRDFARTVLAPLANACLVAGAEYDMEEEIERLAHE